MLQVGTTFAQNAALFILRPTSPSYPVVLASTGLACGVKPELALHFTPRPVRALQQRTIRTPAGYTFDIYSRTAHGRKFPTPSSELISNSSSNNFI